MRMVQEMRSIFCLNVPDDTGWCVLFAILMSFVFVDELQCLKDLNGLFLVSGEDLTSLNGAQVKCIMNVIKFDSMSSI